MKEGARPDSFCELTSRELVLHFCHKTLLNPSTTRFHGALVQIPCVFKIVPTRNGSATCQPFRWRQFHAETTPFPTPTSTGGADSENPFRKNPRSCHNWGGSHIAITSRLDRLCWFIGKSERRGPRMRLIDVGTRLPGDRRVCSGI